MGNFNFIMAFLMGLTGSIHCAGMCGPIALVMPFQNLKGVKKIAGILLYHFGRIGVYALLGLTLFSFKLLFSFQIQQYISISTGFILFLAGIFSLFPSHFTKIVLPWTQFIQSKLGQFIRYPRLYSLFITGVLNGLLPCGMVYMALSAAISTSQSAIYTMALMFFFGLGTMPMLLAFVFFKNKASLMHLAQFKKLVPLLMTVFGVLFMLRGLGLGIPYLSPKMMASPNHGNVIECHKP